VLYSESWFRVREGELGVWGRWGNGKGGGGKREWNGREGKGNELRGVEGEGGGEGGGGIGVGAGAMVFRSSGILIKIRFDSLTIYLLYSWYFW